MYKTRDASGKIETWTPCCPIQRGETRISKGPIFLIDLQITAEVTPGPRCVQLNQHSSPFGFMDKPFRPGSKLTRQSMPGVKSEIKSIRIRAEFLLHSSRVAIG